MAPKDRIRLLIEERLKTIDAEERELKDALAAIEGKRKPGRPRKSGVTGDRK